jgi:hypothetical protein
MQALAHIPPSASARHAEAILVAWIRGDVPQLRFELESSRELAFGGVACGGADERLELLSAVASTMMSCQDLSARTDSDPQIRLCVKLLAHLAAHCKSEN